MLITLEIEGIKYRADLSKPIDLSIPLKPGQSTAWYVNDVKIEPVRTDAFTGSVAEGGSVNFRNISFNPHGNGTHTECLGHITPEVYSVNQAIKTYFSIAQLISIKPQKGCNDKDFCSSDDSIITLEQIKATLNNIIPEALIIRTLPNKPEKCTRKWSNTNWPQLDKHAAKWMADNGVKHLLIDLPSIDRETDGGKLLCHHAFWKVPENPRMGASITELIYIPDEITDGQYLLELQFAPFENDASPGRPVLYKIDKLNEQ
jgi:kynurenine formamidase